MTLDDLIEAVDLRFDRWELRRYTQEFEDGKVKDPVFTLALPIGTAPDEDGIERTVLRDFGHAASPAIACERALDEYAKLEASHA